MDSVIAWIIAGVVYGAIIMMGALGELLTEKGGHLNLGVPGIMYLSGFLSFYAAYRYEVTDPRANVFVVVIISTLVALLIGGLCGFLYSLMCVTFKCNQNVMGLLLTTTCVGFGKFLSLSLVKGDSAKASLADKAFNATIPGLSDIPVFGQIFFDYGFMVFVVIIFCILADLFFRKSRPGLSLRAVGENPATADAAGINVTLYKYLSTTIGCALCGLAGMMCVLQQSHGTWGTNNGIEAIGWLAVALVIFASWRPMRLIWGSILFGLLFWAYNYLPVLLGIPPSVPLQDLMEMLPYLATIIILIINSALHKKGNQPPASLGQSYFRENR